MQTVVSPLDCKRRYAYADYYAINDDNRYEVMEGTLMMVPAPNIKHQRISGRIYRVMANFVSNNGLGEVFDAPTDVVLSDDVVVQPDILFISGERAAIIGEQAVMGAPDLVVEISSPSSSFNDSVRKKEIYQRFGVKEYWLVFPEEKAIEIMTLEHGLYREFCSAKDEGTVSSKIFPGFEVDLKGVF
ncbi:MAG: Uma2 family endonuclease [Deltaproteobacteria bacterium]|nr:Uma2 family endonuclease [Deltaproteobacteria bacterium]